MTAAVERARATIRDLTQAVDWLAASLLGTGQPYQAPTEAP